MKKKNLFFTLLLGLVLVLVGCSNNSSQQLTKNKGELTIGLEGTYAPYSYRDGKKLEGFEVEFGKALAKEMGLKANFVPTKWDSLIAGLNANTFDVILNNMAINKDRVKRYNFADPYIYSKPVLIVKSDNPISSVQQIKGQKFAAGTGTDNFRYAEKFKADVVSAPDFQTAMSMIKQNRVIGAMNSKEAFLNWKKTNPAGAEGLKTVDISDEDIPVSEIAPMLNKKSSALTKKMSKAVKKLHDNGTLTKLSLKYFNGDITKK